MPRKKRRHQTVSLKIQNYRVRAHERVPRRAKKASTKYLSKLPAARKPPAARSSGVEKARRRVLQRLKATVRPKSKG